MNKNEHIACIKNVVNIYFLPETASIDIFFNNTFPTPNASKADIIPVTASIKDSKPKSETPNSLAI